VGGRRMREARGFGTMFMIITLVVAIFKDINGLSDITRHLVVSFVLTILIIQFVMIRESKKEEEE